MIDDVTHEVLATVPERELGGHQLVRILEELARTRGLPKAIKTDNCKELCSRAIVNWAHARCVQLFLTESDKPNHNAYIESFNRRFHDECTNDALVHQSGTCQSHCRSMVPGIQRGATQAISWRANALSLCKEVDTGLVKLVHRLPSQVLAKYGVMSDS